MTRHLVRIESAPISVAEVVAHVSHGGAGAVNLFVGMVRDENEGRPVVRLEYEAYPEMATSEMRSIMSEIAFETPGVRLGAIHRIGMLSVGDLAVVCAASAPHRDEAFSACRRLIDRIKASVPIWKRESGPDGSYWVGFRDARCHGGH